MLLHRSGTLYEDMYWIDLDTLEVIAEEVNMTEEESIVYSKATERVIRKHENIMTIHTHPNSFPPSIADLNSNYLNNYVSGVIICHDGTIYQYSSSVKLEELYYDLKVANLKNNGYNEVDIHRTVIGSFNNEVDIQIREVVGNEIL